MLRQQYLLINIGYQRNTITSNSGLTHISLLLPYRPTGLIEGLSVCTSSTNPTLSYINNLSTLLNNLLNLC